MKIGFVWNLDGLLNTIFILCVLVIVSIPSNAKSSTDEFRRLMEAKEYHRAYKTIKGSELSNDPESATQRGLLYFFLGGEVVDKCRAVKDLEIGLMDGKQYLLPFLNYIYNGDWAAVASIEGQPFALFLVAKRHYDRIAAKANPMHTLNQREAYKRIVSLLKESAKQYSAADILLTEVRSILGKDLPAPDTQIIESKSVVCPKRSVE